MMSVTKNLIICLALLFGVVALAEDKKEDSGQVIFITGQITDKQTGEPIPFVNVGVVGTYIGAASNVDGFYEVKIPGQYRSKQLSFSAVGYGTYTDNIAALAKIKKLDVALNPKTFVIQAVDIEAKSTVLYKRIRDAVDKIEQNYLQLPFSYDLYYRSEKKENGEVSRLREAALQLYDDKGYHRGDAYQVFRERNYKFLEVRKNFDNVSLADGTTYLDELLELDIVRVRGNILNKNQVDDYDLELVEETEYENEPVWVIAYKNKKPSLASTGDYYITKYSGRLFIKKSDLAIVKNETQAVASNYSKQGRSFYTNPERQEWKPIKITYNFTTIYKKHLDYYYLSYISYNRNHELVSKKTAQKKKEELTTELLVTSVETLNPVEIKRRAYYENKPYNEAFWKTFNIIKDL